MAHEHRFQNREFIEGKLILFQNGQPLTFLHADLASLGFYFTRKYFNECGFSCSIGSNQAIAVARNEFDADIFEE